MRASTKLTVSTRLGGSGPAVKTAHRENSMRTKTIALLAVAWFAQFLGSGALRPAAAQTAPAKDPYPAMAPLDQYLIADQKAEIALARTAAPPSISDDAEVMVLTRDGYKSVAPGKNGFMCLVERGWGAATDN